jgi:TrmH family RNA methyltransferase
VVIVVIRSSQNQKLKTIRRSLKSKGDLAPLEGPHLLDEALRRGVALEDVFMTPEFLARDEGRALHARLSRPAIEVDQALLRSLTDADAPQGSLAIARLPRHGVGALPRRTDGIYVYAERLQDPGNVGALARSAEAAGAVGLALGPGSAHPNHPRALRASAGSLLRLPIAVQADAAELFAYLADLAPRSIALDPHTGEELYSAPLTGTLVLLLGSEGPGLSAELLASAELRLRIPLAAGVESLNATIAAAVVLFEIHRRRG